LSPVRAPDALVINALRIYPWRAIGYWGEIDDGAGQIRFDRPTFTIEELLKVAFSKLPLFIRVEYGCHAKTSHSREVSAASAAE
jgi:hypothetical protein